MRIIHRRSATATAAATVACAALLVGTVAAAQDHDHAADLPYRGDGHMMVTPDQLEWGDIGSMAPPAQIAVIEGDLSAEEPFTIRLLLPDGYEVRPHVHPEYERVTVISGTFHFAHGEAFDAEETRALPAGSVAIMAPGEPMFGYASGDTVIQLHGTGPWGIDYIDPGDDPRS
jgi:quercetin dioxygenase-like cupin family protein